MSFEKGMVESPDEIVPMIIGQNENDVPGRGLRAHVWRASQTGGGSTKEISTEHMSLSIRTPSTEHHGPGTGAGMILPELEARPRLLTGQNGGMRRREF